MQHWPEPNDLALKLELPAEVDSDADEYEQAALTQSSCRCAPLFARVCHALF